VWRSATDKAIADMPVAAMVLVYSPFAQRSLVLMGAGQSNHEAEEPVR
jgi:hypothetical protein